VSARFRASEAGRFALTVRPPRADRRPRTGCSPILRVGTPITPALYAFLGVLTQAQLDVRLDDAREHPRWVEADPARGLQEGILGAEVGALDEGKAERRSHEGLEAPCFLGDDAGAVRLQVVARPAEAPVVADSSWSFDGPRSPVG
jgi:hypothetical protein